MGSVLVWLLFWPFAASTEMAAFQAGKPEFLFGLPAWLHLVVVGLYVFFWLYDIRRFQDMGAQRG